MCHVGDDVTALRFVSDLLYGCDVLVDLVVFDMAGTTVYDGDAVRRCFTHVVALAGIDPPREAINSVMGMSKPVAIRTLLESARGAASEPKEVARLYAEFERSMIEHYRSGADVREADGATEVMRQLRASGIKVALDTGFTRAVVDAIVQRLRWGSDVVDISVTSDEVQRGRPHPDMLLRAMSLVGVSDPVRVAKVGDTPADLAEGTAAGCGFVVGVTSGSHARHELEAHPHTHLIASLRELPPLLGVLAGYNRPEGEEWRHERNRDRFKSC